MKLRKKLMLGVAAGAIAAVAIAAAAFAQSPDPGSAGGNTFRDRVAQLLGIERSTLDNAIQKAQTEAAAERLDAMLKAAVDAGRITQAQADEIKSWYQSRPASADQVAGLGLGGFGKGFGFDGRHGFGGRHGRGFMFRGGMHSADAMTARLDALVQAGTLTQKDADAIKAWVNARPAALGELKNCPHMAPVQPPQSQKNGTSAPTALEALFGIPL